MQCFLDIPVENLSKSNKKKKQFPTSGECLQMSLNADAAILLSGISGSWIQSTNRGTAPASTTACDSSVKE